MARERKDSVAGGVAARAKLLEVHERLCGVYQCPIPYFHSLDPLSELISSMLSHRTRNADSGRAFKQLRARFADWAAMRDAPTAEVQDVIAPVTWPELKAPRLQEVLRRVGELRDGVLSLDFLRTMSVSDARQWLEQLPGVGPKTSAAVLSFSTLRMRALPVDSHHHRVAVRLRIIAPSLPVGPSHEVMEQMLPPEWSPQQVYDHHEVMMLHGQRCCYFQAPDCQRCAVLSLCPTGQSRLNSGSPGAEPAEAELPGQAISDKAEKSIEAIGGVKRPRRRKEKPTADRSGKEDQMPPARSSDSAKQWTLFEE